MKKHVPMNAIEQTTTNHNAEDADTTPLGISLLLVRLFFASMPRSAQRLKAIAAVRASTMQSNMSNNNFKLNK